MGFRPAALYGLVFLIPSLITAIACIGHAVSVRSRASVAMAVGAAGLFVVAVASRLLFAFILAAVFQWTPGLPSTSARVTALLSQGLNLTVFAFGLLFSISLLVVLRDAARRVRVDLLGAHDHLTAATASPQSTEQGLPTDAPRPSDS